MSQMIARAALPVVLATASIAHAKTGPARAATEAALAKIKHLNDQLHAVIAVNPEALADADALDKEPTRRGPLHGVPVILKDNIATRGPMATTAGSLAHLAKYLAAWAPGAAVKTLVDVVAFNQQHRAEELTFFGQEYFERAVKKGPLTDLAYVIARDKVKQLAGANLEAVFAQQKLDAIVVMTAGPAWLIDLVNGDGSTLLSTTPAAAAGTPAITVPTAMERGLPMGLTFMGRAFSAATLLRLAAAYETATHARRPPMLPPTVALPGLR